jgi:hypothetical protein
MAGGILDQHLGCTGLAFMCIEIKDSIFDAREPF